jgi:hypothetical protein
MITRGYGKLPSSILATSDDRAMDTVALQVVLIESGGSKQLVT